MRRKKRNGWGGGAGAERLPGKTRVGKARPQALPFDFLPPSFPRHLWLNLRPTLSVSERLAAPSALDGENGRRGAIMIPYLVLELKELRTLPHPDT